MLWVFILLILLHDFLDFCTFTARYFRFSAASLAHCLCALIFIVFLLLYLNEVIYLYKKKRLLSVPLNMFIKILPFFCG